MHTAMHSLGASLNWERTGDVLSMANGSAGAPGVGSLDNLQTAVNYLTRSLETAQRYCEDVAVRQQPAGCAHRQEVTEPRQRGVLAYGLQLCLTGVRSCQSDQSS